MKPLTEFDPRPLFHFPNRAFAQTHQEQGCYDGKVTEAIDQEAEARADASDDESGDRRPDQPRQVEERGIEGDGVAEVFFALDEFHDHGLPHRQIKGIDYALNQA
jgi:hypothetical protein